MYNTMTVQYHKGHAELYATSDTKIFSKPKGPVKYKPFSIAIRQLLATNNL